MLRLSIYKEKYTIENGYDHNAKIIYKGREIHH